MRVGQYIVSMIDAAQGAGGDVVLLVPPGVLATASLQRAYALARTLRARLHVLSVLPRPVTWEHAMAPAAMSPSAMSSGGMSPCAKSPGWLGVLHHARSIERQLRLWVQAVIVSTGGVEQRSVGVRVRMGDAIEGTARSLRRLSLRAVVVAHSDEMTLEQVQLLARRLGAPVSRGAASARQERFVAAEPSSSRSVAVARRAGEGRS